MSPAPSTEFKFRINDEAPEDYLNSDVENLQVRRLGRRIAWIAFLIPCLVGILLAVGYFDLKRHIARLDRSGLREIEALATDLNARIAEEAAKQSAFETSAAESIATLRKRTEALEAELKSVQASVQPAVDRSAKAIEKTTRDMVAVKVDRQELDLAVGRLQKAIDPLEARIQKASGEIGALDQNLTRELAAVSTSAERLQGELTKLEGRIAAASGGGVDSDYLDARMLKEQRIYQLKLDQATRSMERDLAELDSRLKRLEQRMR